MLIKIVDLESIHGTNHPTLDMRWPWTNGQQLLDTEICVFNLHLPKSYNSACISVRKCTASDIFNSVQLSYGRIFLFHKPVGDLNTDMRLCSRGSLLQP